MKIIQYNNATVAKYDNTKIVTIASDKCVKLQFKKLHTGKSKPIAYAGNKIRNENLFISFLEFNIGYEGIKALIKTLQIEIKRHDDTRSNTND